MINLENIRFWDITKKEFIRKDIEIEADISKFKDLNKHIDCQNFYGIPAGIDIHVHFRQPGYEHKEDIESGCKAALHGGTLAVLDMPNTNPITDSVETLLQKKRIASKQNYVKVLVAVALTGKNLSQIRVLDENCDAYKVFMAESFGNLSITSEDIESALNKLENYESTKPIIFHAEDPEILEQHKHRDNHYRQRPPEAEASGIQKVLQWAKDYSKLKFHITHLSSHLSLKILEISNIKNLTTDTCPRYLMLTRTSEMLECFKKVNPPLRDSLDSAKLLEALAKGQIEMLSSDHSPHTIQEKTDPQLCPSGMPGVQEIVLTALHLVAIHAIDWERAIEALNLFPSRLFNLEDDEWFSDSFIIVDPEKFTTISKEWVKSKSGWSPFEGKTLKGKIDYIIKNGELVARNL